MTLCPREPSHHKLTSQKPVGQGSEVPAAAVLAPCWFPRWGSRAGGCVTYGGKASALNATSTGLQMRSGVCCFLGTEVGGRGVFFVFWVWFFFFSQCHNYLLVAEFYSFIFLICLVSHSWSFESHFKPKSVGQILRGIFTFLFFFPLLHPASLGTGL